MREKWFVLVLRKIPCWFVVIAFLQVAGFVAAKQQSAAVSSSVRAGGTHATRLRNLPQGAFVDIKLEVDGPVGVLLLDNGDFKAFPAVSRPLFEGSTLDKLGFGVAIREPGNYYVVVDNRNGSEERQLRVEVTAGLDSAPSRGKKSVDTLSASEKLTALDDEFEKFTKHLRRFFVFDDIEFRVAKCGSGNAYSSDGKVILCAELGPRLVAAFSEEQDARNALMFALLHEISHVLLRQWGIPMHDNEEVVDELTTVVLKMFGEGDRARAPAEYFSRQTVEPELRAKSARDDRHPLSVQRARNITGWLDDPDLELKWQKILVPHMQTKLLERLKRQPTDWTDLDLVVRELELRTGRDR